MKFTVQKVDSYLQVMFKHYPIVNQVQFLVKMKYHLNLIALITEDTVFDSAALFLDNVSNF